MKLKEEFMEIIVISFRNCHNLTCFSKAESQVTSVLYGCDMWSLTLKEKFKLQMSENKVLMKIFGCKKDKVTRQLSMLHNIELNYLYGAPSIRIVKSKR
jgi:hypothetical protein